jgi:predicted methyltransferase
MRTIKTLTLAIALCGALATTSTIALAKPADVAAAVANASARSEDNVKLDESRKPADVLKFLGLKSGDQAIDLFGANRYWAEIMAPAVGPKGHVTVWEPTQFYDQKAADKFAAFQQKAGNTHLVVSPFEAIALDANSYDFAMLNLNYHDVYWESAKYGVKRMEPDAFVKTVYASMKPGGVVGVIDHVGNPGDARETVEKYHRIDPAVVKADFERAGFKFEGESDLLRNPADDHSLLVFNEKIRGKTDRFVYKFRKPKN